jgi:hypothetical protein
LNDGPRPAQTAQGKTYLPVLPEALPGCGPPGVPEPAPGGVPAIVPPAGLGLELEAMPGAEVEAPELAALSLALTAAPPLAAASGAVVVIGGVGAGVGLDMAPPGGVVDGLELVSVVLLHAVSKKALEASIAAAMILCFIFGISITD